MPLPSLFLKSGTKLYPVEEISVYQRQSGLYMTLSGHVQTSPIMIHEMQYGVLDMKPVFFFFFSPVDLFFSQQYAALY